VLIMPTNQSVYSLALYIVLNRNITHRAIHTAKFWETNTFKYWNKSTKLSFHVLWNAGFTPRVDRVITHSATALPTSLVWSCT